MRKILMESRKARNLAKKWMRKRAKGLQVIVNKESRTATEIVREEPCRGLFLVHGTQAGEAEFGVVRDKLEEFGRLDCLVLVPGIPYCFARFSEVEAAVAATEALNRADAEIDFPAKPQGLSLFYTSLELESLQLHANVKCDKSIPVPGLSLIPDFISLEQESQIVAELDSQPWTQLTNRRVQHYGYEFKYGANSYDEPQRPMPAWSTDLLSKLREMFDISFNQLTINDYAPGDSIPPHTDSHSPFEETLACISLLSPISINYRHESSDFNLYVPPLSLLVMQGEARYVWKHSIQQRKFEVLDRFTVYRRRRLSLTFRKTRTEPCRCPYPKHCDAQGETQEIKPVELSGEDIEQKWVHDVYDSIASHFSHTRYKPWPKVKAFLDSLEPGSLVLDIGCGNGKYLVGNDLFSFGTDRSSKLLEICERRGFSVFTADCCSLPVRPGVFDAAICIAVIHHLSTTQMREDAVTEICRILALGGQALIYVWAKEQTERFFPTQDCLVPWHLQKTHIDEGTSEDQSVLYQRYYHVFVQGELEAVVNQVTWREYRLEVTESYFDRSNWVVRLTKVLV